MVARSLVPLIVLSMNVFILMGCSPPVGGEAWCEQLRETHKVDWSTRDATEYAKNCIFR